MIPSRRGLWALFLAGCLGAPLFPAQGQDVATAQGASLRALDTVSGDVEDFTLDVGQTTDFGHLRITLKECRYPAENPAADGYALLTIIDRLGAKKVFDGWMIASSPGLNALDHPRYDVWVLRCKTSSTATDGD